MSNTEQNPAIIPYLTVDGATEAVSFYERAFGAKCMNRQPAPDGQRLLHAALALGGGVIMLSDEFPEMGGKKRSPVALGATPVTIHITTRDVDQTWARAVEAGAKVVMPLADQFWGDRYGILECPFGHRWSMSTPKRKPSQEELDRGAKEALAPNPK
jgi:PhnB protein